MAEQTIEERLNELKQKQDYVGDPFGANDLQTLVDGIVYAMSHGGNVSVAITPLVGGGGYKITINDLEGIAHDAIVKDGGDAYAVYESTVPEGQTPMSKSEWLASLKGAPGNNGHNPCLGVFEDASSLPTTGVQDGDYAYADVSGVSHIFRYDSSQETPWVDKGEGSPDNQTAFDGGNGPAVASLAIDGTGLVNPASNALAKAGDVMQLKGALGGVTYSEVVPSYTVGNGYIDGTSGNVAGTSSSKHAVVTLQEGVKKVRFNGVVYSGTTTAGFAFYDDEGTLIQGSNEKYEQNTGLGSNATKEYVRAVPNGAKYFKTCVLIGQVLNAENFYVYTQMGKSLKEMFESDLLPIQSEFDKMNGKYRNVSLEGCPFINGFQIGTSTGKWVTNTGRFYLVPVVPGEKVYLLANRLKSTQYAFLTGLPTPVSGETANFVSGTSLKFLNTTNFPQLYRTEEVPSSAAYLYIYGYGNTDVFTPESVIVWNNEEVTPQNYDTYIEENIISIIRNYNGGSYKKKKYKIDDGVSYKVVIRVGADSYNAVTFYDETGTVLSNMWGSADAGDKIMQDLTIPSGTRYVELTYPMTPPSSGYYTSTGGAALMRPLTYGYKVPTNQPIYCVSKVASPVMPYNYDTEETSYPQSDIWSAWAFMLPDIARNNTGKPIPLTSFFHGSSGFVTPEAMGYNSANTSTGIVASLLANGIAVFDINGWGVSFQSDQYSRHWGSPLAVATAKKAYTVLTEVFNCRKGMTLSGISMGGAIMKSYAMTYPEDVVACAMEAPSEIGMTIRRESLSPTGEVATAWGGVDKELFVGYSPLVRPMWIKKLTINNESVPIPIAMDIDDMSYSDFINSNHRATTNEFMSQFPVECVIWHGDADDNVYIGYSEQFIRTIRNAGCNGKLRLCPNCTHNLNTYSWVMNEVVAYIKDKLGC